MRLIWYQFGRRPSPPVLVCIKAGLSLSAGRERRCPDSYCFQLGIPSEAFCSSLVWWVFFFFFVFNQKRCKVVGQIFTHTTDLMVRTRLGEQEQNEPRAGRVWETGSRGEIGSCEVTGTLGSDSWSWRPNELKTGCSQETFAVDVNLEKTWYSH